MSRFLVVASVVFVVAMMGCQPDPSQDCTSVCDSMVDLYRTATGSLERPFDGNKMGRYPDADTTTDGFQCSNCCPLSRATEPAIPFLEYYIASQSDSVVYTREACVQTCEDFTFSGSAPTYSGNDNFSFKACLALDKSSSSAKALYKDYFQDLGITNKACLDTQCADILANPNPVWTQEEINARYAECWQGCIEEAINATTDSATLNCWLLEACRAKLADLISGEERQ